MRSPKKYKSFGVLQYSSTELIAGVGRSVDHHLTRFSLSGLRCQHSVTHLLNDQATEAVTNEDESTMPILTIDTKCLACENKVVLSKKLTYLFSWTGPTKSAKEVVAINDAMTCGSHLFPTGCCDLISAPGC